MTASPTSPQPSTTAASELPIPLGHGVDADGQRFGESSQRGRQAVRHLEGQEIVDDEGSP